MPSGSRVSIYDVAGHRVHPDGRRVNQSANKPRTRYWDPGAVQDAEGNWIAMDLGSAMHVPYMGRRGSKKGKEQAIEDDEDDSVQPELSQAAGATPKSKSKKGKERETDTGTRPSKRRKYQDRFNKGDLGLFEPGDDARTKDLPSDDLLKSIHHFASHHYAENGFLINSSKLYREKRKKQREARDKKLAKERREARRTASPSKRPRGDAPEEEPDESEDEQVDQLDSGDDDNDDDEIEEEDPIDPDAVVDKPQPGSSRIRGPGRPQRAKRYRDMYKVFDGSALVALGIICQEYVKHMVKNAAPPPPAGGTSEGVHAAQSTGASLPKPNRRPESQASVGEPVPASTTRPPGSDLPDTKSPAESHNMIGH